jgi:neutral trehalase
VPRPESYREDVEIVKQLTKPADKHRIWKDISTAAESGWGTLDAKFSNYIYYS